MNIALVFPPFFLDSMYNLPPLGLINLATAVREAPCRTVLLDFPLAIRQGEIKMGKRIYDDCAERILGEEPDLVAVSVQCTTFPAAIQICKKIKRRKNDVKIVLGGHSVSFLDRLTLEKFPFVDAVVRGEGETTFKELADAYAAGGMGEGVNGATCRVGRRIVSNHDRPLISNLDDLPLPDYDFAPPLEAYREACELPRSIAILEAGRGCPHRCIYCSQSIMWRRRSRTFSIERLTREMEVLHRRFGAECFLLAYDQFTAKRPFVEAFCRRLIETGLNRLPWYCISRLDSVDAPLLALMREAGCESMCYGIDSGSKRTLAFIRKQIDENILFERVRETAEQGIVPTLSFVLGFPEERKEDIDETLDLALQTGVVGNSDPLTQLLTVLPGTDLHRRYKEALTRKVDAYFSLGLEFDNGRRLASDEALIDSSRELFSSFYNLPCPGRPLEELDLIAGYFPLMVRLYPKTFSLLAVELRASVSDLFLTWLGWLKDRLHKADFSLSPRECFLYFGEFVAERLAEKEEVRLGHLTAVLKYETLSLEAGRIAQVGNAFEIDLNLLRWFRPRKNRGALIGEFEFDMHAIIDDLKAGRFAEAYPPEKTFLAFRQEGEVLDVTAVNAFGRDFIKLCDGKASLEQISKRLYTQYGADMEWERFWDSCVEAVRVLAETGLIEASGSEERRKRP